MLLWSKYPLGRSSVNRIPTSLPTLAVSNRDNNKCQFKKNYVSRWTVHGPKQDPFTAHIKNELIEFYGPDSRKQMRATCYNEIQTNRASLNDRYVIEVNDMPKGW